MANTVSLAKGKAHGYEPSLRVPLACRGPGIPAGEIRIQLVNNLDLTATIVDWAEATPGTALDGTSLVPILKSPTAPWRSAIFFEGGTLGAERQTLYGVRTVSRKYMIRKYMIYADGSEELYDLVRDPYELTNIAGLSAYKVDLELLRSLAEKLKTCSGEACWVP